MATTSQRSFSGGEVSPAIYARTDTVKFANGLRGCRNNIIMKQGGSANRPGTLFVNPVKDSTKKVRLIPWVFNETQAYALELGNLYIRFYQNGAPIIVSALATWSNATTYGHGDLVASGGVNYYSLQNGNLNHTPVSNPTWWYPMPAAPGSFQPSFFEIPTPYVTADLSTIYFAQSADVMTLVHPNYPPQTLARLGATDWIFLQMPIGPFIVQPAYPAGAVTGGAVSGTLYSYYMVTTIDPVTGEESLGVTFAFISTIATVGNPITLIWTGVPFASEYNIYKAVGTAGVFGAFGIIGTVTLPSALTFVDTGYVPDYAVYPPQPRNPFSGVGNYPSTASYFQQRLLLGNTNNAPETIWASRVGYYNNFTISPDDSSAVTFTMAGRQVNQIRHLIDLNNLLPFTSGGEYCAFGDANGAITPTSFNIKQQTYHGASNLRPIVIGGFCLFVQARGSIVLDMSFAFIRNRYEGDDLTIYASHLVQGFTLVDWAYAEVPNSIIWAVRSDGVLLGLTYVKEQQILAWHRHDTDGKVENVCVIPENGEDALYMVVNRTVNGSTVRYVERMNSRFLPEDIVDASFVDCGRTYDGRNTGATTMTLTGGTLWVYQEVLTLTASVASFSNTDIGNEVFLDILDSTGDVVSRIRFQITGYTSTTVVTGNSNKNVPVGLQAVAIATWTKAVKQISGLSHLEGKNVSVFGDGFVVASPNNAAYDLVTVTGGIITLEVPVGVAQVGLPYTSDLQTLDIDTANGETLVDKKKRIAKVWVYLQDTRGLFFGADPPTDDTVDPLENLYEMKVRNDETMDEPVALASGTEEVIIPPEWDSSGRIFIRQVDPLPASILAVYEEGNEPFSNGGG